MLTQTIERTTLSHLIHNENYCRKVLPFIKSEYFSNRSERVVFEEIEKFLEKYNSLPTKETLTIGIDNRKDINDDEYIYTGFNVPGSPGSYAGYPVVPSMWGITINKDF